MSHIRAAQLTIGGCISRSLVPGLCAAIRAQRVALDWGEEPFAPESVEDLLAARRTIDGELVLSLFDEEARHGRLNPLEAFLKKRRVPFDLQSAGGFDGGATLEAYRPDEGESLLPIHGHEIVTPAIPLWEFTETLAAFRRQVHRGPRQLLRQRCDELVDQYRCVIPARPTPLPSFEIGKSLGLRRAA